MAELAASELFASSQTVDWKLQGVGAGELIFSAVFNFQSRASSQVYGAFKTSGTNGMKSNMLSSRKIPHHPHQGSEDGTGLSV